MSRAVTTPAPVEPPGEATRTSSRGGWRLVAVAEVAAAVVVVLLDVPPTATFPLLGLVALSLTVRRRGLRSIGLERPVQPLRLAATTLALAVAWSMVHLGVVLPVLEHTTGQRQDLGQFDGLQGNLGMLLGLVAASWTLAAMGEELAYRGFLFTRTREAISAPRSAVISAVLLSSMLFGLVHAEQGVIGVVVTALDGVFWCWLLLRYRTLWAPILAHGFNNTIGLVAFFIVGPIHGWW